MLGQCRLGLSNERGDLGYEIVNSRLVIQRQGGLAACPWEGARGEGAPTDPIYPPDGKLRAIGHMSKAMTGGKGLGEARGSLLCWGRQGPGMREGGWGVPEAAARTRDTQAG